MLVFSKFAALSGDPQKLVVPLNSGRDLGVYTLNQSGLLQLEAILDGGLVSRTKECELDEGSSMSDHVGICVSLAAAPIDCCAYADS